MKKKIYLVTGNHQLLNPLKDFFELIENIFADEYEVIKSNKIVNSSINIIIDECTNEKFINQIINKNHKTKIIYFLTEFFTSSKIFKIKSFNYFSKNEFKLFLVVLIIEILNKRDRFLSYIFKKNTGTLNKKNFNFYEVEMVKFKKMIYKFYKPKYKSKIVSTFIKYLLSITLYFILLVKSILTIKFLIILRLIIKPFKKILNLLIETFFLKIFTNFNFYKYMYLRRKGFEKIKCKIDFFLCCHKKIYDDVKNENSQKIFFVLNKLKKIKNENKRLITISGENNKYRQSYLSNLNIDYPNNFKNFLKEKFLVKNEFGRYSINPKKSLEWEFTSPMRYILSIQNNEIPIITEKFNDLTSDNIVININEHDINSEYLDSNYTNLLNSINNKIRIHNTKMAIVFRNILFEIKSLF